MPPIFEPITEFRRPVRLTMLAMGAAVGLAIGSPETALAGPLLEDERNTIDIVERHGRSVVGITVTVRGSRVDPFESIPEEMIPPWFRDVLPQPERFPRRGAGSGFVVDAENHIVTNYHVVKAALHEGTTETRPEAEIRVVFPGRDPQPSFVVGANALYDLALLRLEDSASAARDAAPIPLADSSEVSVGQKAIAIGNPFGLESTVTSGIVSGLGRDLPAIGQVAIPMIQTDAAINPGNSGGPLLNSQGEAVGINAAIVPGLGVAGQRGFIGIGFAIPSNFLREGMDTLLAGGLTDLTSQARLGVSVISLAVLPDLVQRNLLIPERGVMIIAVEENSPAAEAGLRAAPFQVQVAGQSFPAGGDVIQAVNGTDTPDANTLQRLVFARRAGDVVTLTVWREGEVLHVETKLREILPPGRPAL